MPPPLSLQDVTFPDRNFAEPTPFGLVVLTFIFLNLSYFSIPFALVYHAKAVPEWLPCAAVSVFCAGELTFFFF